MKKQSFNKGVVRIFVVKHKEYIDECLKKGMPLKLILDNLLNESDIKINYTSFLYAVTRYVTGGENINKYRNDIINKSMLERFKTNTQKIPQNHAKQGFQFSAEINKEEIY